ncbi:MAG: hypothetical protein Q7T11_06110 [Deltaproteobacteria bacterium]|nr:hypothetical protein [Deltaproteobacteria bacterium]
MWKNLLVLSLLLAGCDVVTSDSDEEDGFTVGGGLTGLVGSVVLQNNSDDDLALTGDGDFTFETVIEDGEDYAVTDLIQPDILI